jgi:hypothetical protein
MTVTAILLLPPVAFALALGSVWLQSKAMNLLREPPAPGAPVATGKRRPYACGEEVGDHRAQPEYGPFFRFAAFFTVMHVVALVAATVPRGDVTASLLAAAFLVSAGVALKVLFRR